MEVFALSVCVIGILIIITYDKEAYSPNRWILFITALMLITNISPQFGLSKADVRAYAVIGVGTIGLVVGSLPFFIKIRRNVTSTVPKAKYLKKLNERRFLFFTVVMFVLMIIIGLRAIQILLSGNTLLYVRANFSGEIIDNSLLLMIHQYLLSPFIKAYVSITIANSFLGKFSIRNIVVGILLIALYSISDGSRYLFITTFFEIIIGFFVYKAVFKKEYKINPWARIGIIILAFMFGYILIYITESRGSTKSIFETVYIYFAGAVPFLGEKIKELQEYNVMTFGLAFFRGILDPIKMIFNYARLGFLFPDLYSTMNQWYTATDQSVYLGKVYFNAFVTPYYAFYMDFGYLGVFLGSFVYGYLGKICKSVVKSEPNVFTLSVLLLFMESVASFMIRWQFGNYRYMLAYIWIFILFSRHKTKEQNV